MQTKVLVLQIPDSPAAPPLPRRINGRTALTGVQNRPLLLHRVNTLGPGRVSSAEPADVRRQAITDQHGERRRPERPVRQDVPRTVREGRQPAIAPRGQLASRVKRADHVAGNRTTRAVGPTERGSQPRIARHRDARPGELHQRQREPSEPSGMTQVGITSLGAEHVHGIGADGASAVDGDGTHKQPP